MLASTGPKAGTRFLRALCCLRAFWGQPVERNAASPGRYASRVIDPTAPTAESVGDQAPVGPPASPLLASGGLAIILLAALVPELRPLALIGLVAGWAALRVGRRPEAIAWAAVIPVAIALGWPILAGADVPLGRACTDVGSAIVVRRLGLAVVVLAAIGGLAAAHRSSLAELGLGRPRPRDAGLALLGCVALAAGGLVIGPAVARPFFGQLDFPVPQAALLPAVVFGVANGVTEELQYRGAMQAWLGRLAPAWIAIGFQALLFGIVHAGPDVVALLPLHVALLAAVGAAGGVVRARTGSLVIPIGVHVGADIALYVGLACRAVPA